MAADDELDISFQKILTDLEYDRMRVTDLMHEEYFMMGLEEVDVEDILEFREDNGEELIVPVPVIDMDTLRPYLMNYTHLRIEELEDYEQFLMGAGWRRFYDERGLNEGDLIRFKWRDYPRLIHVNVFRPQLDHEPQVVYVPLNLDFFPNKKQNYDESSGEDSKLKSGKKNKTDNAQSSTVKLLQNSFTRQLLESTSKPKSLNINSDPLMPNSAWSWLERWMAVSTSKAAKTLEPNAEPEVHNAVESSATFNPRIHVALSECGTEPSISSTLDSLNGSEIENIEVRQEVQFAKETPCQPDVQVKQHSEATGILNSYLNEVSSISIREGEVGETKNASVDPVASEVSPLVDETLEMKPSDVENDFLPESLVIHMDSSPVVVDQKHQENGYKSPVSSAISHKKVPESQGSLSSQASVEGKRNKVDKQSHKKQSSPSAEKKPSSNPNIDSGARSSIEYLSKDHKSGKRRNSFGSTKSDNAVPQLRDYSSWNTQGTESPRAKANSPRSSPDVHDKEVYSKKRHSLPEATNKHNSPHAQRSTPQEAQGTKQMDPILSVRGNGSGENLLPGVTKRHDY